MSGARPFAHLSRRYRFSAAHRLHAAGLSEERNREVFGKCNNPFGHGHNYVVQVTVSGAIATETGMVVNLGELDEFAARELLERFDCANLNVDSAFRTRVPSSENLCLEVWRIFARWVTAQPGLRLERVRIEETGNNAFEYGGEGADGG